MQASEAEDELTQQMREAANAELEARASAQSHIDKISARLAKLGYKPDVRIRKDDPPKVVRLRNELRTWRARLREEIHPAHARSRR